MNELIIILDRSGSMETIVKDMQGGLDTFLNEQKANKEDDLKVTVAIFDHEYEVIHNRVDLKDCPRIMLVPRGATALLDAVGRTLSTALVTEHEKCIVMIITDGYENASREWTNEGVKSLVKRCEEQGWLFMFLGADVDAFSLGGSMGFKSARTMSYEKTAGSIGSAMRAGGQMVSSYRSGVSAQSLGFSDAQREETKSGETEKANEAEKAEKDRATG